jgi:hypothetical protein
MTDQEINRAVAESVGWRLISVGCDGLTDVAWLPPGALESITAFDACGSHPPDYCNSYDAIMPLVKALKKGRENRFMEFLFKLVYPHEYQAEYVYIHSIHDLITATPRQLCEAYLAVGGADA